MDMLLYFYIDWTLFSEGLVLFKSVSTFDIDAPTSTILSSIAMNSVDLPDLTLECSGGLQVSRFIRLLCYSDMHGCDLI